MIRAVVAAAANVPGGVVGAPAMVLAELPGAMLLANVIDGVIAALTSQGDPRHGERGDGREGQEGLGDTSVHGSLSDG